MRAYYFTEYMERNSDLQWEYLLQLCLASYKKTVLKEKKNKTTNKKTTKKLYYTARYQKMDLKAENECFALVA